MTAAVIIGKLLPYIIGLLAALAAWLKGHAEVQSVKKDREETKKERDDSIQHLSLELNRMNHQNLLNEDFRQQLTMMNSTITEVKTLVELLVDNKIKNGGH